MSSSQQQPTNSNNNQSQTTNPQPQAPVNNPYDDYLNDPSISEHNTSNITTLPAYPANDFTHDPSGQPYPTDYMNSYTQEDDVYSDEDAVIASALEAQFYAAEEMMNNDRTNDNDDDGGVYSDAVQNAFKNYENEYSRNWTRNDSTWTDNSADEQDEMYEQMRECMRFMSQEYSTAEMPTNLIERTQESKLNPDAVEFCPSWSSPSSISTGNEPIRVTSWEPCKAQTETNEEEEHS